MNIEKKIALGSALLTLGGSATTIAENLDKPLVLGIDGIIAAASIYFLRYFATHDISFYRGGPSKELVAAFNDTRDIEQTRRVFQSLISNPNAIGDGARVDIGLGQDIEISPIANK